MEIVFFGADSGVGCTMITQCAAEYLAQRNQDKKILMLCLSGYSGVDYTKMNFDYSIDDLQIKLQSDVLTVEELESMCGVSHNLYVLQGCRSIRQRISYFPEDIQKIIKLGKENFDYIVIDAGGSVEIGMGLGALQAGGKNILVTTQSKIAAARYRQKLKFIQPLNINFDMCIVNSFVLGFSLPEERELKKIYDMPIQGVLDYSDYGMQAEFDGVTLLNLDKTFKKRFFKIMDIITECEEKSYKKLEGGFFQKWRKGQ